jgi:hypothetical protein
MSKSIVVIAPVRPRPASVPIPAPAQASATVCFITKRTTDDADDVAFDMLSGGSASPAEGDVLAQRVLAREEPARHSN